MKSHSNIIYLRFTIQSPELLGIAAVPIDKVRDVEKRKNPQLCAQDAINQFTEQFPAFDRSKMKAIYTGDIIFNP